MEKDSRRPKTDRKKTMKTNTGRHKAAEKRQEIRRQPKDSLVKEKKMP